MMPDIASGDSPAHLLKWHPHRNMTFSMRKGLKIFCPMEARYSQCSYAYNYILFSWNSLMERVPNGHALARDIKTLCETLKVDLPRLSRAVSTQTEPI